MFSFSLLSNIFSFVKPKKTVTFDVNQQVFEIHNDPEEYVFVVPLEKEKQSRNLRPRCEVCKRVCNKNH